MKAMNFESAKWRRSALDGNEDEATLVVRRRRNRIILVAVAALILVAAAFFLFAGGGSDEKKVAVGVDAKAGDGGAAPAVTVIVPGRHSVARIISATGQLAARRDMPVGIAGEGGRVVSVLV